VTPIVLITTGGMLIACGLVVAAYVLWPAPPNLAAALAALSAAPFDATRPVAGPSTRWLPARVSATAERHLGVSDADLAILDLTRAQLTTRALSGAVAGLLAPAVVTTVLALTGNGLPPILPAGFAIGLAITLWIIPIHETRQKAAQARLEFTAALRAFLILVAQERAARGSPTEALEESSRPWTSWPFQLIHTEVLRAELAGEQPWNALRTLGDLLGVRELRSLADIVSTAADGAAVFDTLLAEAGGLHHAELAAQQARANATSEQLVQPLALMAIGFLLLVLTPPLLRLFST
jgi:hypothetical protein